jgi:ubiquinone/menaquinone biosynthesis C-methylase UbiE
MRLRRTKNRDGNNNARKLEEVKQAYNHAHNMGERHHMQVRLQVPEELGYLTGETLVDIGCGSGRFLQYFTLEKVRKICIGLDVSKTTIHATKRRFKKIGLNANLIICDAQKLPFADNTFDVAWSTDMIEHLPNTRKGVHEIVRVSKDKIAICVPNKLCPIDMSHIAELLGAHHPPEIENYVTRFQLKRMLQNSGIKEVTLVIVEKSFLPIGWLFVNRKILLPMSLVKLLMSLEGFLEKTPLRYTAGVIVSCCRKKTSCAR